MSERCTERGTGAALRLRLPLACIVVLFDCALHNSHNQDLFLTTALPAPPVQACNAPDPASFKSVYNGHALFLNAGADLPQEDLLKHWRQDVRVTCDLMLAAEEAVGLAPGKEGIVELLKRWSKGPMSMQELEKATTEMLREHVAAGGGVVPGGDYQQSEVPPTLCAKDEQVARLTRMLSEVSGLPFIENDKALKFIKVIGWAWACQVESSLYHSGLLGTELLLRLPHHQSKHTVEHLGVISSQAQHRGTSSHVLGGPPTTPCLLGL